MEIVVPFVVGFLVGVVVGRWWALVVPVLAGIVVGGMSELEVSPVFVGSATALIGAVGVSAGVLVRRRLRR